MKRKKEEKNEKWNQRNEKVNDRKTCVNLFVGSAAWSIIARSSIIVLSAAIRIREKWEWVRGALAQIFCIHSLHPGADNLILPFGPERSFKSMNPRAAYFSPEFWDVWGWSWLLEVQMQRLLFHRISRLQKMKREWEKNRKRLLLSRNPAPSSHVPSS